LLVRLDAAEHRRLRRLAKLRDLTIATDGPRTTARVHDMRELRQALMRGAPLIFVSPLYRTKTHPDWQPLPRMRAAAFARLANRRTFALGGMNARRYAKIAPLGFIGWAGVSAFRI
jgi:thiamine-phosphate pyrophosphorylase